MSNADVSGCACGMGSGRGGGDEGSRENEKGVEGRAALALFYSLTL